MIRRQLSEIVANPQELSQLTFADMMRAAADAGLYHRRQAVLDVS